jgi:hypothetical protein
VITSDDVARAGDAVFLIPTVGVGFWHDISSWVVPAA